MTYLLSGSLDPNLFVKSTETMGEFKLLITALGHESLQSQNV